MASIWILLKQPGNSGSKGCVHFLNSKTMRNKIDAWISFCCAAISRIGKQHNSRLGLVPWVSSIRVLIDVASHPLKTSLFLLLLYHHLVRCGGLNNQLAIVAVD